MDKAKHISGLTKQALVWLDNMKIPYEYSEAEDYWEFKYKRMDYILINDEEDDVIFFAAPVEIPGDNEDECKSTFDLAKSYMNGFLEDNGTHFNYSSGGIAYLLQWWRLLPNGQIPKLYKCRFKALLNVIHQLQWELSLAAGEAYLNLFNPPSPEVVKKILKMFDKRK